MIRPRPLPCTIGVMALLIGVKSAGLIGAITVSNPAHANGNKGSDEPRTAHGAPPPKPTPAANPVAASPAPPSAPPEPAISDAERATLQDLRTRRKELDGRAARLDEREALVAAAERRLGERVGQLTALQAKLEALDKDRQERQDANWRGLVRTYEDMRPRDAAAIFNDLDSGVLIPVLDRMKDAKAAPILAAMIPERARAATAQLARTRTEATAAPKLESDEAEKKR